jgi:hypothetical protein
MVWKRLKKTKTKPKLRTFLLSYPRHTCPIESLHTQKSQIVRFLYRLPRFHRYKKKKKKAPTFFFFILHSTRFSCGPRGSSFFFFPMLLCFMFCVVFVHGALSPHRHGSSCQRNDEPSGTPCASACFTQCSLSCPSDTTIHLPAGTCTVQFPLVLPSFSTHCVNVHSTSPRQIRVTATNRGPAGSISFAPLRIGFSNGTFDAFDRGVVATAPIISIAEGGSGSDWFPAFAQAEPQATTGTVANGGPLLPGATAVNTFTVSPRNRFFTFGSMAVPSNDLFIGNDAATEYLVFDEQNRLFTRRISLFGRDIWDAGSETTNATNAAFLQGSTNSFRVGTTDPVIFSTTGITAFNGLTTTAGYVLNARVGFADPIYEIELEMLSTVRLAGGVHTLEWIGVDAIGGRARCTQLVTVTGGSDCSQ